MDADASPVVGGVASFFIIQLNSSLFRQSLSKGIIYTMVNDLSETKNSDNLL